MRGTYLMSALLVLASSCGGQTSGPHASGGSAGTTPGGSGGSAAGAGGGSAAGPSGGSIGVGGGACFPGAKVCPAPDGQLVCVDGASPDYGCKSTSCAACLEPHATAQCSSGACAISKCDPQWNDCNADPSDGCKANLATDVNNCGACGLVCDSGTCLNGQCAVN